MKKVFARLSLLSAMAVMTMASYAQTDAEMKQMIESNNKMIGEAMKAGDVDKMMTVYAEDAIQLPNNEKMIKGVAEIRKSQESMVKEGWKVKEYTTNVQQVETHGDIVTEIGTYNIKGMKDGSEETFNHEGKYLCLWEKQADGTLKLTTEIWNHDKSPNMGMAEAKDKMDKDKDWDKDKSKMGEDKSKMGEDKSKMGEDKSIDDQIDDNR